jgi:hypothetical protein
MLRAVGLFFVSVLNEATPQDGVARRQKYLEIPVTRKRLNSRSVTSNKDNIYSAITPVFRCRYGRPAQAFVTCLEAARNLCARRPMPVLRHEWR